MDEEESEMTLGFWYLFQEALWSVEYSFEEEGDDEYENGRPLLDEEEEREKQQNLVAKAVYSQLVQVLRRKVVWPQAAFLNSWTKGLWKVLDCNTRLEYYSIQIKRKNSRCKSHDNI